MPPEILGRFPGLDALGRTTTRLHPRPGAVTARQSHVGGPLLWPVDEPWPTCDTPHQAGEDVPIPEEMVARMRAAEASREVRNVLAPGEAELYQEIARLVGPGFSGWGSRNGGPLLGHRTVARPHAPANPMLAAAQLRADDVPDLPRPGGADLLQVLMCPFDHDAEEGFGPAVRLRWRREADVSEVLDEPPRGEIGDDGYAPRQCRLHPERVVEYPYPEELPDGLREQVMDWEEEGGNYVGMVMAVGWKVGGYARWGVTDAVPMPCPRCARPMPVLLTMDTFEYDDDAFARWRPVEEQHVTVDHADRARSQEPTGVRMGRGGSLRVFACLSCPDTPHRVDIQ